MEFLIRGMMMEKYKSAETFLEEIYLGCIRHGQQRRNDRSEILFQRSCAKLISLI